MTREIEVARPAPAVGVAGSPRQGGNGLDMQSLLNTIWRRKWYIILPTVATVVFTVWALGKTTPLYTSTASLVLEPREETFADIEEVIASSFADQESLATEVEVLRSRTIVTRVIDQLGLQDDPEFNDSLRAPGFVAETIMPMLAPVRATVFSLLGLSDQPTPEAVSPTAQREQIIAAFSEQLRVSLKPDTRVIFVSFESESPEKAARIVDALTKAYLLEKLESSYEATVRANQWLSGKISELQGQVSTAEKAIEQFRRDADLLAGRQGVLVAQKVSEVSSQLLAASASRAEAEARYNQVRRLTQSGDVEAAADVLQSPIIQGLVAQEVAVKRKLSELSEELGARHPRIITVEAELRDLRTRIKAEVDKVVRSLANEVNVARARETTLQRAQDQLESQMASANAAEVQMRGLEREAAAQRTILETFMSRAQETTAQLDQAFRRPTARVISEASVPDQPSYPPKGLIIALAFLGSAVTALAIVVLLENLQRGLRNTQEVEEQLGVPALGMIPLVRSSAFRRKSLLSVLGEEPTSLLVESFQSCFTNLLLAAKPDVAKAVLVTSTIAGEGKSTLAVGLARTAAFVGYRTLLIEADLRRPTFEKLLKTPPVAGLSEYLAGKADLSAILRKDETLPLTIIQAGAHADSPSRSLRSDAFSALIDRVSADYDLIIFDTPPMLAVSDAPLLLSRVDGVVLAVRWSETRRDRARLVVRQLNKAGGRVLGVVLTMVDVKKHAAFDFADSAYHARYSRQYYARS